MAAYYLMNRNRNMDGADAISGLIIIALCIVAICWFASRQHDDEAACQSKANYGDHYADPITRTCGVIVKHGSKTSRQVAIQAECAPILALESFAHVRHCFEAAPDMAPDLLR